MSAPTPKSKQIADYAWVHKGRKYWNVWMGNPFMIGLYKIPLTVPEKGLIRDVKKQQASECRRFTKQFPEIKWEPFNPKATV